MNKFKLALLLPVFTLGTGSVSHATVIDSTDKYAWSETSGWLNFAASDGDIKVLPDHLEGYVWADNIGWIRLGTHTTGGSHTYTNDSPASYGVNRNRADGKLSGYAWSENTGWINFGASGGSATVTDDGTFSGAVWGDNIGWIKLAGTITTGTAYKVQSTALDIQAPNVPVITVNNGGTVSGSGEAGATITIKDDDGTVIGTTTVDNDGQWSFTPDPALTDATTLDITQSDDAGNTSSAATSNHVVDTQVPGAPVITVNNGGTIAGSGEAGAAITIKDDDGTVIGTTTVDNDGQWSFTPDPALTDGTTLNVTQSDATGNTSPAATTNHVVDTQVPGAPVITVNNGGTIAGSGEAGATITIKDGDGTVIGTTTVDNDGQWSFTPDPALTDATTLDITQSDAAGNTSSAATSNHVVDTQVPGAPVITVNNGGTIGGSGEAGATITIKDDDGTVIGTTTVDNDGQWSFTPDPALTDATTLDITQSDGAGNTSSAATSNHVVDTQVPGAPVITVNNGGTIGGSGEAGATITIKDDDGTVIGTTTVDNDGQWSFTPDPALTDATTLDITQSDAAGNTSSAATSNHVVDTQVPGAPVITVNNGGTIGGSGEAGATITIKDDDGTVIGTTTVDNDGQWSFTPDPALTDASTLDITQSDAAGNTSSAATSNHVVDTQVPGAPVITVNNGGTIGGSGEAGATITIKDDDGTVIGTTTVDNDGQWSFTPDPALTDATTLDITQSDTAGNTSSAATSNHVVDTQVPGAPVITVNNGGTIGGSGEAGATITIKDDDGTVIGTTTVDNDGQWSFTPDPALTDASTLDITQSDAAGNTSSAATSNHVVDTQVPGAPVITVNNGGTIGGSGEAGATITIKDDDGTVIGTTTVDNDGQWSFTPDPALTDATTLDITQSDGAGNTSSAATSNHVVDTQVPGAPVITVNNGGTIGGSGEAGATITIKDDDGTVIGTTTVDNDGQWSFTPDPALTDASTLDITQSDAAGNTSSAATSNHVVDTQVPGAPVITVNNGGTIGGSGEAGATITIKDGDGTVIGTTTVDNDGQWSFTPDPALTDATTLDITQSDAAGNTSSAATSNHVVDTQAPNAPTLSTSDGSMISGTGEPGAMVTVTDSNGALVCTAIVDGMGNWSCAPATTVASGETLTAVQSDASGNTSLAVSSTVSDTGLGLNLAGNNLAIPYNDQTPTAEDNTDFGTLEVTGESETHGYTVYNPGTLPVILNIQLTETGSSSLSARIRQALVKLSPITMAQAAGATDFAANVTSLTIPAGGSADFNVTFDPTTAGTRQGQVNLLSGGDPVFNFMIQGTGIQGTSSVAPQNIPVFGPLGLLTMLTGLLWFGRRRQK